MKKIKVAVFISDVGFGHMVRQREIIKCLLKNVKNIEITIVNGLQIEILKKTFGNKVKYIKRFNNIKLFKAKEGYLDLNFTSKILDNWNLNLKKSYIFFKIIFSNNYFIISVFVPEIFFF